MINLHKSQIEKAIQPLRDVIFPITIHTCDENPPYRAMSDKMMLEMARKAIKETLSNFERIKT